MAEHPSVLPADVPAAVPAPPVDPVAPPVDPVAVPSMGENQPATPEEQQKYNQFIAQAYTLIYSEKFMPKVVEMLKGEGDPIEGLARAASNIILRVMTSAEEAGEEMSGDVLLGAGTEVLEDLAELSKLAKVKDFEQDPDALEGAYFRTLDQVRLMLQQNNKLNPEAAEADMQKFRQMDESGELTSMFTRLAEGDDGAEAIATPLAPERGLMSGVR